MNKFIDKYYVARENTNSLKWDLVEQRFNGKNLLPLWVADLDFKVPEGVQRALHERVDHGVFGYSFIPDSYYEAFFQWEQERYQVALEKEWIRFANGVVSGFYWMVSTYTQPEESVLILSPVYYPFYDSIKDTGRHLVTSDLINEGGNYRLNFAEIEAKIVAEQVKLYIHCSPHNPVGRVWTREEQEQLFDLCLKHDVMIVSDEIHQDLTRPETTFVSALAMDQKYYSHLVVLKSISKTFNLAAMLISHIIIPAEARRQTYDAYAKTFEQSAVGVLGAIATEAAYREGGAWLESLLEVVEYNYELLATTFARELPQAIVSPKEGTYLAWVDLSAYVPAGEMVALMQDKCGIAIDYGEWFGANCEGFIRLNLGTKPDNIAYAVQQIVTHIQATYVNK